MRSIEQIIADHPTATAAEVAALRNLEPERFKPVTSPAVLEWLGTNGRLVKLNQFVATSASSGDANVLAAVGAVQTVLIAAANANAYLSLDPSSQQVALLGGLVQIGVLTQGDADALLSKAKLDADTTEADVQAVFDRIARGVAVQSHINAAAQTTDDAQAYIATARQWVFMGEGDMPEWNQ